MTAIANDFDAVHPTVVAVHVAVDAPVERGHVAEQVPDVAWDTNAAEAT